MGYTYYDLDARRKSDRIDLIFPGWNDGERVVVISPHDDDALLGAGYAVLASQAEGAKVSLFILCDGRAGYTEVSGRRDIVDVRRRETIEAYKVLGIDDIVRFDIPDFSLESHLGWDGIFLDLLRHLRERRVTRMLIPNGYREHADHSAAHRAGREIAPQVGDPLLPDLGKPTQIRSCLVYSVWGAFDPDATAFRGIKVTQNVEDTIREAMGKFATQGKIIEDLIRRRDGSIEIYHDIDPRPPFRMGPYLEIIGDIDRERGE